MTLYWSSRSPFVRKVMVVAHETGLADRIDRVAVVVSPFTADPQTAAVNPLSKIPTLIRADGTRLYDSHVICEYLDGLHQGPRLFPADGEARLRALGWQAMGDGLIGMLIFWRTIATRFTGPDVDALAIASRLKLLKTIDDFEARLQSLEASSRDIGGVTVGVALEYVDFRFGDTPWRDGHPGLADWHARFCRLPSAQATRPHD
jgi:glutathione S-transferase